MKGSEDNTLRREKWVTFSRSLQQLFITDSYNILRDNDIVIDQ
jgi:hypothetical protein